MAGGPPSGARWKRFVPGVRREQVDGRAVRGQHGGVEVGHPDADQRRARPRDPVERAEDPGRLVGIVVEVVTGGDDDQRAVLRAAQDLRPPLAGVEREGRRVRARAGAAGQRAVADQLLGDAPHDVGRARRIQDRAGALAVTGPELDRRAREGGLGGACEGERAQGAHARDDQLPPPHGAQSSGSAPGRSHRGQPPRRSRPGRALRRGQSPRTTSPSASTVAGTGASEMVTRNSPAVRPGPVSCTSPTSAGATRQVSV